MSNSRGKFEQWRALEVWERKQLILLAVLLPLVWLGLRLLGLRSIRKMAMRKLCAVPDIPEGQAVEYAQRMAMLTAIAARHGLYRANCLHQALALCWRLRSAGLPAEVRIGVLPDIQPLQAHAWVELEGVSLGQSVDKYKKFPSIGADE